MDDIRPGYRCRCRWITRHILSGGHRHAGEYQVPRPAPCRLSCPASTKVRKCPLSVLRLAPVTRTASATVTQVLRERFFVPPESGMSYCDSGLSLLHRIDPMGYIMINADSCRNSDVYPPSGQAI